MDKIEENKLEDASNQLQRELEDQMENLKLDKSNDSNSGIRAPKVNYMFNSKELKEELDQLDMQAHGMGDGYTKNGDDDDGEDSVDEDCLI